MCVCVCVCVRVLNSLNLVVSRAIKSKDTHTLFTTTPTLFTATPVFLISVCTHYIFESKYPGFEGVVFLLSLLWHL